MIGFFFTLSVTLFATSVCLWRCWIKKMIKDYLLCFEWCEKEEVQPVEQCIEMYTVTIPQYVEAVTIQPFQ